MFKMKIIINFLIISILSTTIYSFMKKYNGLPRLVNQFNALEKGIGIHHSGMIPVLGAISEGKKSSDWILEENTNEILPSSLYKSDCITYGVSLALAEEYMILNENMDDALELAQMSLKAAENRGESDSVYVAYAEGLIGEILYRMGNVTESVFHFRKGLQLYESHTSSSTSPQALETVSATQLISWAQLAEKDYEGALGSCSMALAMTERLMGENATDVAGCCYNLGTAYLNTYQPDVKTEALFKRALEIYQNDANQCGDKNKWKNFITNCHESLGHVYVLRGRVDMAENEWKLVLEEYRKNQMIKKEEDKLSPSVAVSSIKNLGDLYMFEWNDEQLAREMYSEAYEALKSINDLNIKDEIRLKELMIIIDDIDTGDATQTAEDYRGVQSTNDPKGKE